jgi:hypothetical protein
MRDWTANRRIWKNILNVWTAVMKLIEEVLKKEEL